MDDFTKIECCTCGVLFAVSLTLDGHWRRDKTRFYCPNGHGQSYTKTTADILQEKLNVKEGILFRKSTTINELEREVKKLQRKLKRKK